MEETPTVDSADVDEPQVAAEAPVDEAEPELDSNTAAMWRGRIERTKRVRKDLIQSWSENVDYRRGKPFGQDTDDLDRVNVNLDWPYTKNKHAALFSQMPQVYLTERNKQFKKALVSFRRQLNATLTTANVGSTIDECVFDTINAAGIGIAMVSYQSYVEMVDVPETPLEMLEPHVQEQIKAGFAQLPMTQVPKVISQKHSILRVSPADFLWPLEFEHSDFDQADWIGHSGRMLWDEAANAFNLQPEQKEKVFGERGRDTTLRNDSREYGEELCVEYDELFYWAHKFTSSKHFKQINRIVFVKGIEEPVFNGPWEGQKFDEQAGTYVGACVFPIRVLTLTYISDDAIPPSDTAIARPQVNEMIKSRSQIIMNRDRSTPLRWADVNRIDPMVMDTIMRGEFQAIIPVQGDGSRSIGEVARAAYPKEDFAFDDVIRADMSELWGASPNQGGGFSEGRHSAAEAKNVQQGFNTRIGYERSRVASFITGIAEVVGAQLALFGNFTILGEDEIKAIDETWDRSRIASEFVYWIRPDSTVLLDANQRTEQLLGVLDKVGKSGYVNPKVIIAEILELNGIDTDEALVDPQPDPPPPPNISYRFSGVDDLTNPLSVAILMKAGQCPSPQELQAAKELLKAVDEDQPTPPQPPVNDPRMPAPPVDANPKWGLMPSVTKRTEGV